MQACMPLVQVANVHIIATVHLPMHAPSLNIVPNGQKQPKLPGVLTHLIRGSEQELTSKHSSISISQDLSLI